MLDNKFWECQMKLMQEIESFSSSRYILEVPQDKVDAPRIDVESSPNDFLYTEVENRPPCLPPSRRMSESTNNRTRSRDMTQKNQEALATTSRWLENLPCPFDTLIYTSASFSLCPQQYLSCVCVFDFGMSPKYRNTLTHILTLLYFVVKKFIYILCIVHITFLDTFLKHQILQRQ